MTDIRPVDLPEVVGGRYRVVGEIGRGGMGRVVKVVHVHTGETLAMKLLLVPEGERERGAQRFLREARALAQVRGDHVVRVMDAGLAPELGGQPYLVTELLEGEDLGRFVSRRGPLTPGATVPILWQVAQGLARVHKAGLVHRDLKPANIYLHHHDGRVVVKLLDFGLVRSAGRPDEPHNAVTAKGEIVGTPLFMSPEQIHGTPESVGAPTDIWAVGILTFYLLTGKAYWNLREMPRGFYDIGVAPLTPPSILSPSIAVAFDAWFLRSCSRNPASRWPDPLTQVQELAMALGVSTDAAGAGIVAEPLAVETSGSAETRLSAAPDTPTPATPAAGSAATIGSTGRQRRQVTVLFYRLVYDERTAREMDPEEFEAREARLHALLDQALSDPGHTSQQASRGGRFVFYGYPVVYGGDARRAVEAAHRLIGRAKELDVQLRATSAGGLQVRLGIHTGVVIVGPSATMPGATDVVGQALGAATDVEHGAAPGQVVVSASTWRLVRGQFEGRALAENRFLVGDALAAVVGDGTGGALIGRDAELGILQSCLQDARAGDSQMVLVSGEVGIGKSRLVQALHASAQADDVRWLPCQASPYFQRTAFHPVIDLMRRVVHETLPRSGDGPIGPGDLTAMVATIGLGKDVAESLRFLLPSLGDESPALAALSPQLKRERAIQGLTAVLNQLSRTAPIVVVVEDLHWADPSTLEWLDRLSVMEGAAVLVVMTARPDFSSSWSAPARVTPIQLRRLGRAQTSALIAQSAGRALPPDVADLVARTTDGIPLFIEELSRLVAERPADAAGDLLSSMSVPTSLGEALSARLDRLGPSRFVAEIASVFGMVFDADDVRALAGDDGTVPARLQELVRARIIQPLGLPPHSSYSFHHALLRDAAYGSLPRQSRRSLHLAVAQRLSARAGTLPEVLAHHFDEGGSPMAAAGLLLQAGQDALARSANVEARGHFKRGAEILDQYARTAGPDDPPVDPALDTTLRTLHGMAWVVSKGWAAAEAAQEFSGAMARVRLFGDHDVPGSIPALWGNWVYFFVTGRMADAAEQGTRLRRAADLSGDPGAAMMADLAEGTLLFDQACFADGIARLDAAIGRYDPEAHFQYRYMYGQDPWVYGMVFKAWALWCAGSSDTAASVADQAVARAIGLSHPNSLGFALGIAGIVCQYRGDLDALSERVAALTELSLQQGWVQWSALAKLLDGAAAVMRGDVEAGVAGMRDARAIGRMIGERSGSSHYDALLADGLCRAGLLDEASAQLADITTGIAETGEHAFQSEVSRLAGEIARRRGNRADARALFETAAETAAATGALAYELRARVSLAQLAREGEGDPVATRFALGHLVGRLAEGRGTADLRVARAALRDE